MNWKTHIQPLKKFFTPIPKVKPKREKVNDPDNRDNVSRYTLPKPSRKAAKGKSR